MQHRNTRGSAWTIIAIIVAVIVLLIFVAPRVMIFWFLNKQVRENPQLALTPQPLPPAPEWKAKATTIRAHGVEADVPWGVPKRQNAMNYFTTFDFDGGLVVYIYNPTSDRSVIDTINDLPDPQQREMMRKMYGLEKVQTRYDAFRALMEMKPDPPSLLMGVEKQAGLMMSVGEKLRAVPSGTTAVFQFETDRLRGFQSGVPGKDREVRITVFDSSDQRSTVSVHQYGQETRPLTQPEINFIARSLRRTPAEAPAPEGKSPAGKTPGKPGNAPPKKAAAPAKPVLQKVH